MKQNLQNNNLPEIENETADISIVNVENETVFKVPAVSEEQQTEVNDAAETDQLNSVVDDNEEVVIRKRKKRRHRHRKKKKQIVFKVLIIIAAIIAVVAIGAFAFFQHGAYSVKAAPNLSNLPQQKTIEYNGHKYALNEDMVTVLIIGHDNESDDTSGQKPNDADAILAMAIDLSTGKMNIIGIPRDTMCFVDQYVDGDFVGSVKEQICLAYGYGQTPEEGSQNVVKSASSVLFNIPIQYYYTLDEAAIAELNDAVGGVTLVPLQSVPKANIVEGEKTTLLGQAAHDYVQWRDTSVAESAKDRQERGVQYIKALAEQAFGSSNGNVKTVADLLSIIAEYSVTNIEPSELTYLANLISSGDNKNLDIKMLDGTATQNGKFIELTLDEDELYKTVLDTYYTRVD